MIQVLNWLTGNFINYIGYTVITSKRKIICILSNDASCCEEWDVDYNKEKTDEMWYTNYDEEEINNVNQGGCLISLNVDDVDGDYYEGSAVELTILDAGFEHKIKLWNSHNGYYAHDYFIYDTLGEFTESGLI